MTLLRVHTEDTRSQISRGDHSVMPVTDATVRDAQEKVRKRVTSAKVVELNAPRPGKKAVVLDIDYTIFDLNSAAERPEARCPAAQHA